MTRLSSPARRIGLTAVALGLVAMAAPGNAQAQTALQLKGFLLNPYTPSTPGSDWFVLESLDLRGQARPALRVGLDWAHKPFVLENAAGDEAGDRWSSARCS